MQETIQENYRLKLRVQENRTEKTGGRKIIKDTMKPLQ